MSTQPAQHAAHVGESDFEREVLRSGEPVLVDFWAAWCPPCRALGPTIDRLAQAYQGRAKVVKVDVDASPGLAERYGVQSIPSLMIFRAGQVVDNWVGAAPESAISARLDRVLAG